MLCLNFVKKKISNIKYHDDSVSESFSLFFEKMYLIYYLDLNLIYVVYLNF